MDPSSFRFELSVAADGYADLAEIPPFQGRIDLRPILHTESASPATIHVLLRSGRFYLWGEGFRNVWSVTPKAGTGRARYRGLEIADHPLHGVRLSHYGASGSACVRIDVPDLEARFISPEDKLRAACS